MGDFFYHFKCDPEHDNGEGHLPLTRGGNVRPPHPLTGRLKSGSVYASDSSFPVLARF